MRILVDLVTAATWVGYCCAVVYLAGWGVPRVQRWWEDRRAARFAWDRVGQLRALLTAPPAARRVRGGVSRWARS